MMEATVSRRYYEEKIKEAKDIAFKAGRDSFLDDVGNATIPLSEVYEKGTREVVEWINDTDIMIMLSPRKRRDWQAKLKEWGIK